MLVSRPSHGYSSENPSSQRNPGQSMSCHTASDWIQLITPSFNRLEMSMEQLNRLHWEHD